MVCRAAKRAVTAGEVEEYAQASQPCSGATEALMDSANSTMPAAIAMRGSAAADPRIAIAAGMVLFALSIKASVAPLHGWLAWAYSSTSPAVTALFAALHTKVAVYGLYRIYSVMYDGDARLLPLILVLSLSLIHI